MCTSNNYMPPRALGANQNSKPLGRNAALGGGDAGAGSIANNALGNFFNPKMMRNTGTGSGSSTSPTSSLPTGGFDGDRSKTFYNLK